MLSSLVFGFLRGVSALVADEGLFVGNDFSEALFCLLSIDLRELLHLEVVLGDEVLLLLGEVSQIAGRCASPDLARGDGDVLGDMRSGSDH